MSQACGPLFLNFGSSFRTPTAPIHAVNKNINIHKGRLPAALLVFDSSVISASHRSRARPSVFCGSSLSPGRLHQQQQAVADTSNCEIPHVLRGRHHTANPGEGGPILAEALVFIVEQMARKGRWSSLIIVFVAYDG